MHRPVFTAGADCIFAHSAFSNYDPDACLLNKFVFEFLHSHTGGRSDGHHFKSIFRFTDDRTGMEYRTISDIYGKLHFFLHDTPMSDVPASGHASAQVEHIADMER